MDDDVAHAHLRRGRLVGVLVGRKFLCGRNQIRRLALRVVSKCVSNRVALLRCGESRQQREGSESCGVDSGVHRTGSRMGELNSGARSRFCPELESVGLATRRLPPRSWLYCAGPAVRLDAGPAACSALCTPLAAHPECAEAFAARMQCDGPQ